MTYLTHLEWIIMIADQKCAVERQGDKICLFRSDGELVDDLLVDEKYSKSQQKRIEALTKLKNLDE